jgi:hypothetical protein
MLASCTLLLYDVTVVEKGSMMIRLTIGIRLQELAQASVALWSGHKLSPRAPVARTRGSKTVADMLLEDRE